ncbi:MAG: hypothetical protein CR982_09380 [Candidatus Cloacimonadota bacterium]|nr:MAG: hypothetical protein CR982_09380 [Candidatus Cloacimonadota bacterium]PIE77520.1 MAG: hypothetical protein CSA15_12670 [Candidatus Delongbacteria bacterium]
MGSIKRFDVVLILTIVLLFLFGSLMVLSSTCFMSSIEYDTNSYLLSHFRNMSFAFFLFLLGSFIPYKLYDNRLFTYSTSLILLVVLYGMLISGFANEAKGAARWFFGVQPSEFAKLVLIFLFAFLLKKNHDKSDDYKVTILFSYGILFIFLIPILLQPSFSITALIFLFISMMIFVGGVKFKHIGFTIAIVVPILIIVLFTERYRIERFTSFYFGDKDSFQLKQSKIAIGNGGVFGVGLGESLSKEGCLPEAHNDFIFSIICDEVGLLGALIFIAVYAFLIYKIFKVALSTNDRFAFLVVTGIGCKITIFALANILIAVGAIPTTGVTLPLISYGGSNLAVTMLSLGIVVNISRSLNLEKEDELKRA